MKRLILFTGAALLAALPALAQTPTVDDLLAKNMASRGGAEKLRSISTRKVTGTVTVHVQVPPASSSSSHRGSPRRRRRSRCPCRSTRSART